MQVTYITPALSRGDSQGGRGVGVGVGGVASSQNSLKEFLSALGGSPPTLCGLRLGRLAFLLFSQTPMCPQDRRLTSDFILRLV